MLRLGLTGGIGSGKSTVAKMLLAQGATLIDADAISRATTAPGGSAIAQIAAQFGLDVITPDGAMNRDVMRQRVFADPNAKRQLEAIIHPLVSAEGARLTEAARLAGCALLVFDIPLLVESKRWRQQLDKVLVVDCEVGTQISRVMLRSGWTQEAVEAVIAQQATRAQRLAAADLVIYNDGLRLDELALQVAQLTKHITL
ncbi:MAG: dephospho-CoA kinase [Polaromonas sp.]